jgi:aminoglycoside phosphotransferase family enzyme/predicted kinase
VTPVVGEPRAAVAETHSAVVFFHGDRAYKVKKPVDLGFLDFRTIASRKAACEEEVRLNRRIAPDVYLGVADVVGVDGAVADHLVVMRRMPEDRRLSTLVAAGTNVDDALVDVARQLAALHGRSVRSPEADQAAGTDATLARWLENGRSMQASPDVFDDFVVESVLGLATRYLEGRGPLFADRIAAGRAVDGHGDLLADDIFCLDDGPRVLDCLDFDASLRVGDGLADAAFLAMDLERLGHPELGGRFLRAYAEHADDTWPPSLAHHHVAYRAQVRAKVAAIRAHQGDPAAAAEARRLLSLCEAHLGDGRVRLVLVGGLPGTGKSQLAAAIGDRLDAVVIRSDEVRKELAGLRPSTSAPAAFGEGLYAPSSTERTYGTLLDRAAVALGQGYSVVLDASWSRHEWRATARSVAAAAAADIAELECTAPPTVAEERMRRRLAVGSDPSDATPEIARRMAATWEPWDGSVRIDTDRPVEATLEAGLAALGGQASGTRH